MNFTLDTSIGYLLNRCTILLRIEVAKQFKKNGYDITPEEWVVLNRLWQKDGQSQNEVARSTIKDKTTVVRLIDRMEKKGLVERRSSVKDGRVREIYLTPNGQSLKEKLIPIAMGMLKQSLSGVEAAELATALSVLTRFEQNLLEIE
ncbi:MAG: MarR family transcriptional regulator [Chloroflexota bacterium]